MAQNDFINYRNNLTNPNTPPQKVNLNLLERDTVSLINSLVDSIKEYYKISLSNNSDSNKLFLYYNEEMKNIQILLNDIINNNKYQKFNELFEQINFLNKISIQLKNKTTTNLNNLKLFYDDAKIIVKNIKTQRQKQLKEKLTNSEINDISLSAQKMPLNNIKSQLNQLYSKLLKTINKLNDNKEIIEGIKPDSAENNKNLITNIKKELSGLINFIIKHIDNDNISGRNWQKNDGLLKERSESYGNNISREMERLKLINQAKETKIKELTTIIANFQNDDSIQNKRNSVSNNIVDVGKNQISRILELEKNIEEKNEQILNLQEQIRIYEQNEDYLNEQISDLNKQYQDKVNQYENQIAKLKNYINKTSKNKIINNSNLNPYIYTQLYNLFNKRFNTISQTISKSEYALKLDDPSTTNDLIKELKNKNMNLTKIIKRQNISINNLNKEILSYKNKITQYEKKNRSQLEEMNNTIYKNNKIIEQKDELIKQLREKKEIPNSQININMSNYPNNNEILLIKYENEKLKKEIELLKLPKKIYSHNPKNLQQINLKLQEENNSLKKKIIQLEEDIKLLTSKNDQQKKELNNLESEITKKDEQIKGLQDFIAKLQTKIEEEDFFTKKNNSSSKINKNKIGLGVEDIPEKKFQQKMKQLLDLLNKANKDNLTLQNKNKELQYKLEEKQVQEEYSVYKTEDVNFSNYEEEFDLKRILTGAKDKNKSEDINIDYPDMQKIKDKYKKLSINNNMLEEQVKILISNINCNNSKIKPQINQICQLMKIPAKNIQLIIAGKNKKKILGILD